MTVTLRFAAVVFALAVLTVPLAGCFEEEGHTDPRPGSGSLNIYVLDSLVTESQYQANVSVDWEWYVEDQRQFEDVALCLYDRNGTVLADRGLGTFTTTDENLQRSIGMAERPTYVVVFHPGLHQAGFWSILYWNEGRANWVEGTTEDIGFEFHPQAPAGTCP